MIRSPTATVLLFSLAAAFAGCSSEGLDKVVVHGNVTYDGQPVPNGQIRFTPVDGTPGPVSGGVIKDGKYTASGKGGVPLGKHRVEIYGYRPVSGAVPEAVKQEGGASVQYIPGKYNGATALEIEITEDAASQSIDFNLDA